MRYLHYRLKRMLLFVIFGSLLGQQPAMAEAPESGPSAADVPVMFQPKVPYAENADISDAIRQQCGLNEAMVASIQKYAGEYAWPLVSSEQAPAQPKGKVRRLSAEISHATPGVYAFIHWHTKPAILTVHYKLTEDDRVILDTHRSCSSRKAGILGLDGRACVKLNECVEEQGDYIGKWIKKKLY
ncbi:MAG: hypothetical protein MZV65_37990 [Chromatiales bacterium]|nr:hypothetical protein [Chromatiales bacterium]